MAGRSVHEVIVEQLVRRVYGQPLIENVYRSDYMEYMVAMALGDAWRLTPPWVSWDLEHGASRVRVEVKQSAARQTWTEPPVAKEHPRRPRFDITPQQGYYLNGDADWVSTPLQRQADIYVFAWHPEREEQLADHRCPEQWRFFVVSERRLPRRQKSIGLRPLGRLTHPCVYRDLAEIIGSVAAGLRRPKAEGMKRGVVTRPGWTGRVR